MGSSLRCKVTGHDPDGCGICKRCGEPGGRVEHVWKEVESQRPCYKQLECERCGKEKEKPAHDWEPSGEGGALKCSRCGMSI